MIQNNLIGLLWITLGSQLSLKTKNKSCLSDVNGTSGYPNSSWEDFSLYRSLANEQKQLTELEYHYRANPEKVTGPGNGHRCLVTAKRPSRHSCVSWQTSTHHLWSILAPKSNLMKPLDLTADKQKKIQGADEHIKGHPGLQPTKPTCENRKTSPASSRDSRLEESRRRGALWTRRGLKGTVSQLQPKELTWILNQVMEEIQLCINLGNLNTHCILDDIKGFFCYFLRYGNYIVVMYFSCG